MIRILARSAVVAVAFAALAAPAFAHSTLEVQEAQIGASYKAVLRVPHGCGTEATNVVRVQIPEGFYNVKPMPKAGWTLETVTGPYEQAYDNHGTQLTEGVKEIIWKDGNLPNEWYDEFVFRGTFAGSLQPGKFYFPAIQECANGQEAWVNVTGAADGGEPAPSLDLVAPEAAVDEHAGHMMAGPAGVVLGDLAISGGFARATLPNAPVGGGFLTITNKGAADDRLISVTSPASGEVQLHEMAMEGDVMKMRELSEGIPVPAGETVTLQPGGLHMMFMQLAGPLVEGTSFPVTLTFETAGTVTVELNVVSSGAKSDESAHGHMHGDAAHGAAHDGAAHGAMAPVDQSGMSDLDAITAMQKAMFDTPETPLAMGPIVVAGEYAVSDWAQDKLGGRALLKKTDKGWAIHLCAGAALKDAAALVTIGVPEDAAKALAEQLAVAESSLPAETVALYDSFDGTMMVDESLI